MKWTEQMVVNSHDTDFNEIARPSAVISYIQEAANLQLHKFGPTYEELLKNRQAFVVSRLAVKFLEPVYKYATVQAQTWAVQSSGFSFSRFHRLFCEGKMVCEAESVWALVNIDTHRPCRASEYKPNFEYDEMIDIGMPIRMKLPPNEEMTLVGQHRVSYADTDINYHFNNTKYADMLCDYIDMKNMRVKELLICYLNEAPLHETLNVYMFPSEEGKYLFRTVREDGKTNIEATVTITDI